MIQSNELRVSNLVIVDGSIHKVDAIGLLGVEFIIHAEGGDNVEVVGVQYEYIQPLPLAAKILEKAGFIKEAEVDEEDVFYGEFYRLGEIVLNDDFTLTGQIMPPMKFVHQLQNLYFALTGEELTIYL